jgi:Ni/Co efflux regulator RcnB
MKTRFAILAAMILAASLMTSAAHAQGQGKGKGKSQASNQTAGDKVRTVLPASEPIFARREVTIIQNYFRINRSNLPPGLAKRETLPPGLEKQLIQRGTLPPGLQKKIQPLPIALERQLVVLPTGYRRVVIGGNVILMNPATGLIYDIVRNVIP